MLLILCDSDYSQLAESLADHVLHQTLVSLSNNELGTRRRCQMTSYSSVLCNSNFLATLPYVTEQELRPICFSLDAFGGGFLTDALVAYWFFRRFGIAEESLGVLFFAVHLLNAASHLGAVWLARRIGLVNTMVFTHCLPACAWSLLHSHVP